MNPCIFPTLSGCLAYVSSLKYAQINPDISNNELTTYSISYFFSIMKSSSAQYLADVEYRHLHIGNICLFSENRCETYPTLTISAIIHHYSAALINVSVLKFLNSPDHH